MTQTIPKEQALYEIGIFAEHISALNPDPHCKVGGCFGRGYLGFQILATKDGPKAQLLTCRCSKPGKSEYTRLKEQFDQGLGFILVRLAGEIEKNRRRTLIGGVEYLWGRAVQVVKGWLTKKEKKK